jgi:hypothetical protein
MENHDRPESDKHHNLNKEYEKRVYEKINDNDVYITTLSNTNHWQDAHYHKLCKETYVIQKGKVIFVWKNKTGIECASFKEGSVVVFGNSIEHALFLPKDSIIHTIKKFSLSDKYESKELEKYKTLVSMSTECNQREDMIIQITKWSSNISDRKFAKYSNGYIHFDKLIWQLPTWNFILFAGLLSVFNASNNDNISPMKIGGVDFKIILLFVILLFFITGYYALARWRIHQKYTKRMNAPRSPFQKFGAQVLLQFVGIMETITIFVMLILNIFPKINSSYLLFVGLRFVILITVITECRISKHYNKKYVDND